MGKPQRRKNRLQGYDYSRTGWYFITVCTKQKEHLLGEVRTSLTPSPVGRDDLGAPFTALSLYGQITEKYIRSIPAAYPDVRVDKYVIMPNHVHLIIRIVRSEHNGPSRDGAPRSSRPTISGVIGALKRFVNQKTGASIWQTSFHDHIIRGEADYLRIWHYIDTNPAKWREDCYYKDGDLECPRTIKPT
ncbi:MAG: hypothetical protein HFF60_12300 [Oscillospiraceae bacterium]|nr:hypothetical protein [Oscillospiraceae bacterium]